jgi:hypothetical protein
MKKERYHSNDLNRLILKNKMSTMVEIKEVMSTKVDATIFRKLRELHYSHIGITRFRQQKCEIIYC